MSLSELAFIHNPSNLCLCILAVSCHASLHMSCSLSRILHPFVFCSSILKQSLPCLLVLPLSRSLSLSLCLRLMLSEYDVGKFEYSQQIGFVNLIMYLAMLPPAVYALQITWGPISDHEVGGHHATKHCIQRQACDKIFCMFHLHMLVSHTYWANIYHSAPSRSTYYKDGLCCSFHVLEALSRECTACHKVSKFADV